MTPEMLFASLWRFTEGRITREQFLDLDDRVLIVEVAKREAKAIDPWNDGWLGRVRVDTANPARAGRVERFNGRVKLWREVLRDPDSDSLIVEVEEGI